jgi:hypothetical protein
MEKVTVYGWCHSWQCVADWSWGQSANNVFTLMGAVATFAAAFLALRFSHQEAQRKQSDDMLRARLAAIANVHLVSDVHRFLHDSITQIGAAAAPEGHEAGKHALRVALAVLDVSLETVADDALVFLVPLGANGGFRITRAYATLAHLREQRHRFQLLFDQIAAPVETLEASHRGAAKLVIAELARARGDLAIAAAVLEHAAKF